MLKIANNNKNLIEVKDGKETPFFWLGDTAWLLLHKVSLDEIAMYLDNRKAKKFNVIQAVLIHNLNFEDPSIQVMDNYDFKNLNKTHEFWDKAEAVLKMAAERNMYIAYLPVWGSMVKKGYLTLDNVESYGEFLAERFGGYDNLVWVLGGDIRGHQGFEIWNKLGTTFKKLCPDRLCTFHPFGRTCSAIWFNDQPWLDFNMFQSGHRRYDQSSLGEWDDNKESEDFFAEDNWKYVNRDRALTPSKPILDGEPSYENIPQGLHDFNQPVWLAKDVRRYAYWSVFEGACGHTYGNNSIFQFYDAQPDHGAYDVYLDWRSEMDAPGASQLHHLYDLITGVNFLSADHSNALVDNEGFKKHDRVTALVGDDFAFVYDYNGRPFSLNTDVLSFKPQSFEWLDPTNGEKSPCTTLGDGRFAPPVNANRETDMVLIIK